MSNRNTKAHNFQKRREMDKIIIIIIIMSFYEAGEFPSSEHLLGRGTTKFILAYPVYSDSRFLHHMILSYQATRYHDQKDHNPNQNIKNEPGTSE
jgi:hypothetical protein